MEGDEGGDPGKGYGIDGRDDRPFPASAFILYCYEGGNAWEIQ